MTAPAWATGKVVKVIGLALLVAAVAYFLVTAMGWREAAKANADTVDAQAGKIETTVALGEDGAANAEARNAGDQAATAGRETFHRDIEEAQRHEPETASRADRAVPASVRAAYRARRLARERPSAAEAER